MKTYSKISFLLAVAFFVLACNKSSTQVEDKIASQQKGEVRSVSFTDGKYYVDTMIIWRYTNKTRLVADLNAKTMIDKKTVEEIPSFIKVFLNDISPKGKFVMANPGQEFQIEDITVFAHSSLPKVYGKDVPTKQMIYFGVDKNIALLSYYCGGLGKSQCNAIIKFDGEKIVDFWFEKSTSFAISKLKIITDLKLNSVSGC